MKSYRTAAVFCLALILALTGLMIAALAAGNSERFFVLGGVWAAAVILSFVIVKGFRNRYRKEEKNERTSEN